MSTGREGNTSQPDKWVTDCLRTIYSKALETKTNRTELQAALKTKLSEDLKQGDLKQFEKPLEDLSKNPKSIQVGEKQIKLKRAIVFGPTIFGKGSKLNNALQAARAQAVTVRRDYEMHEAQKKLLEKLEQPNLKWDDIVELRSAIDKDWPSGIKSDLTYLSYYKQAEMLFKGAVLPHLTNYGSARFAAEEILCLLCYGEDEELKKLVMKEKELSAIIIDLIEKNNKKNRDEPVENRSQLLEQFWKISQSSMDFQNQEIAALFVELCREWFMVGVHVTDCKGDSAEIESFRLKDVAPFLDKTKEMQTSADLTSRDLSKAHQEIMEQLKASLTRKERVKGDELRKLFNGAVTDKELEEGMEISKGTRGLTAITWIVDEKNDKRNVLSLTTERFLCYKIVQHLKWLEPVGKDKAHKNFLNFDLKELLSFNQNVSQKPGALTSFYCLPELRTVDAEVRHVATLK